MTIDMKALAADAAAAYGPDHVEADSQVVRINLDGTTVSFVAREVGSDGLFCRAFVSSTSRIEDIEGFCLSALEANFFWRETRGATLSFNSDATAIYLTERLLPSEIADAEALAHYVSGFVDTLVDWRLRVRSAQGGVEALPASADFSPQPDQDEVSGPEHDDAMAALGLGLEVFR